MTPAVAAFARALPRVQVAEEAGYGVLSRPEAQNRSPFHAEPIFRSRPPQAEIDWLVTGQVVPVNPAGSVRGPRHVVTVTSPR